MKTTEMISLHQRISHALQFLTTLSQNIILTFMGLLYNNCDSTGIPQTSLDVDGAICVFFIL